MLKVENLEVNYGAIKAVKGISFEIKEGQIVCLIGANGAGKTTTLRTISGLVKASGGSIVFDGKDITTMSAQNIVKAGLIQVPEGRMIFNDMTVYENLQMGAYPRGDKKEFEQILEVVYKAFPILLERKDQQADTLSGGEQQMLAMARALCSRPRLLMLDEPSMGLSPIFVQQIFKVIKNINELGTTVLLIEQNAKQALQISDMAYVLENGKIVLSGTGKELAETDEVKKAYLGG